MVSSYPILQYTHRSSQYLDLGKVLQDLLPPMILLVFTPFHAVVFLVFTLLYTPCVAAIASVKRELGGKWAVLVVIMQCVIAWIAAFAVQIFGIVTGLA